MLSFVAHQLNIIRYFDSIISIFRAIRGPQFGINRRF